MRYTYPAFIIKDEWVGYCAYLNDFDIVTQGDDVQDAIEMGADALWLMIDDYLQLDKPLPKPTYPEEHEGLLVAISVDVGTERGLLTTKMAAGLLGVSDARVRPIKKHRFMSIFLVNCILPYFSSIVLVGFLDVRPYKGGKLCRMHTSY